MNDLESLRNLKNLTPRIRNLQPVKTKCECEIVDRASQVETKDIDGVDSSSRKNNWKF